MGKNDQINDEAIKHVRKAAEIRVKQKATEKGVAKFEISEDQMYLLQEEVQLRGDDFLVPLITALPGDDINDEEKFPSPCYILGARGLMMKEQSTFYTSITPVKDAGIFAEVEPKVELHFPKLPRKLFLQGVKFLKKSFDRFKGESIVVFLYRQLTEEDLVAMKEEYGEDEELPEGEYLCIPPTQKVSHAGVEYDISEDEEIQDRIREGWKIVGDMHSHADFKAFHSGTDDADEFGNYPGFHITIGDLNKAQYTFSARFVIGRWADKLELEDIIEDEAEPMPEHWGDKIGRQVWNWNEQNQHTSHYSAPCRHPIVTPQVQAWEGGQPYRGEYQKDQGWWYRGTFFLGPNKPNQAELEARKRLDTRHSQGGQKKT